MKSSCDGALAAGSQVSIRLMNAKSFVFSSPGGMTVTKSSNDVSGTGGSDIHLPAGVSVEMSRIHHEAYLRR